MVKKLKNFKKKFFAQNHFLKGPGWEKVISDRFWARLGPLAGPRTLGFVHKMGQNGTKNVKNLEKIFLLKITF